MYHRDRNYCSRGKLKCANPNHNKLYSDQSACPICGGGLMTVFPMKQKRRRLVKIYIPTSWREFVGSPPIIFVKKKSNAPRKTGKQFGRK